MFISLIGYLAAICTTIAVLPQTIKTWKTQHTKDISLPMFAIMATGVFLWAIYGFLLKNPIILTANVITFLFVLPILFLKLKNG